ncbi:MAG: type IV secretory system conjugative DNA transfer family protein [Clostridia bacterium]|nr:type IV secretory system conjugative DNA transfer family protein [Clostridia bacterium]
MNNAGVVVNYEIGKKEDCITCIDKNYHTILVGASGSGKSRSVVIPTITALSLSKTTNENIFVSDVKGELYAYTAENLKKQGYNVYVLDFINPKKSNRFNFLDPIILAAEKGDISLAESLTSDLVSVLVPDNDTSGKGEPIWRNGEQSIIKTGIMAVVLDNIGHRERQTLSNVYYFISEMFAEQEDGETLIDLYMEEKEANNPIKKFYAVAATAPSRTRGSFITSALSTLQIFINEYIDNITCKSDFTFDEFEQHKTAIFVLLPDDKTANNKLVALMVQQIYTAIVELSRKNGGELKNRFNFILDEFSNFTKIDSFETMLTVSRSRNIRYLICIQSFRANR